MRHLADTRDSGSNVDHDDDMARWNERQSNTLEQTGKARMLPGTAIASTRPITGALIMIAILLAARVSLKSGWAGRRAERRHAITIVTMKSAAAGRCTIVFQELV